MYSDRSPGSHGTPCFSATAGERQQHRHADCPIPRRPPAMQSSRGPSVSVGRRRPTGFAARQQVVVPAIRLGGAEARVLAHGPEPAAIHGRLDARERNCLKSRLADGACAAVGGRGGCFDAGGRLELFALRHLQIFSTRACCALDLRIGHGRPRVGFRWRGVNSLPRGCLEEIRASRALAGGGAGRVSTDDVAAQGNR